MHYDLLIPLGLFLLVSGPILYGRVKYGSWTGAFLKGSIGRDVGEIDLSRGIRGSQTLKVHAMKGSTGDEDFVGLVVVSKAVLAGNVQSYKLSKAQAQELARYLNQAAQ